MHGRISRICSTSSFRTASPSSVLRRPPHGGEKLRPEKQPASWLGSGLGLGLGLGLEVLTLTLTLTLALTPTQTLNLNPNPNLRRERVGVLGRVHARAVDGLHHGEGVRARVEGHLGARVGLRVRVT